MTKFDIQESKRTISILTDWWEGLGFGMNAQIFKNMHFADIGKLLTDGKNLGGLAQRIYFGLWSEVATWPVDAEAPLTLDALGSSTGSIAMKPGKRMFELYTTEEKIQTLFENGFPYLKATSLGKDTFCPKPPMVETEHEITRELASPAKKLPKMKT